MHPLSVAEPPSPRYLQGPESRHSWSTGGKEAQRAHFLAKTPHWEAAMPDPCGVCHSKAGGAPGLPTHPRGLPALCELQRNRGSLASKGDALGPPLPHQAWLLPLRCGRRKRPASQRPFRESGRMSFPPLPEEITTKWLRSTHMCYLTVSGVCRSGTGLAAPKSRRQQALFLLEALTEKPLPTHEW